MFLSVKICPNKKSNHTSYNFELASGCNKTKNNMNKNRKHGRPGQYQNKMYIRVYNSCTVRNVRPYAAEDELQSFIL